MLDLLEMLEMPKTPRCRDAEVTRREPRAARPGALARPGVGLPARGPRAAGLARRAGLTLIELIIVLTMLVMVLTVTYKLLLDCLEAERIVEKLTLPEKVGEGILALMREDISGACYRFLGTRVFLVADNGASPEARDEVRFLTTKDPTPREGSRSQGAGSVEELHTITGIAYFLRPTTTEDNVPAYTLFRKEMVDLDLLNPLESPGVNFEIYDRVKSLSVECFDGYDWFFDWNSEERIEYEQSALADEAAAGEGRIARVSDPQGKSAGASSTGIATRRTGSTVGPTGTSGMSVLSTPGVDPNLAGGTGVLPPAGIPVAVKVEVVIYVCTGNKVERDAQGFPLTKKYSAIVPLLAAVRIPMEFQDELEAMGGSSLAGGPQEASDAGDVAVRTFGGGVPGPGKGGRRGDGMGPQGSRRGGNRGGPGAAAGGRGPGAPGAGRLPSMGSLPGGGWRGGAPSGGGMMPSGGVRASPSGGGGKRR